MRTPTGLKRFQVYADARQDDSLVSHSRKLNINEKQPKKSLKKKDAFLA